MWEINILFKLQKIDAARLSTLSPCITTKSGLTVFKTFPKYLILFDNIVYILSSLK